MIRYSILIPDELHKQAMDIVKEQDTNLASVIRRYLKRYVRDYINKDMLDKRT